MRDHSPHPYARYWEESQSAEDASAEYLHNLDAQQLAQREYSKDYDRILYSTAFRRLGGVTQVVTVSEIGLFHNRLTHTLKTAQVGTRLANFLGRKYQEDIPANKKARDAINQFGLDPRVVRGACMAHDLGHPPFGHIAETELQAITSNHPNESKPDRKRPGIIKRHPMLEEDYGLTDGFEGNAQSLRIVSRLAFREIAQDTGDRFRALNLTRATLAAIMKYPWPHDLDERPNGGLGTEEDKWGYYDSEAPIAEWVFSGYGNGQQPPYRAYRRSDEQHDRYEYRTIEAQLMDWADDISYAVHDVEDFFRIGLIPLDQLGRRSEREWGNFFHEAWEYVVRKKKFAPDQKEWASKQLNRLREWFPILPYEGFGSDREELHEFSARIIRDAVHGTSIQEDGIVAVDPEQLVRIEILKRLTWHYVIDRPTLRSAQVGQRQLIRSLYRALVEWVESEWPGPGSAEPLTIAAGGSARTRNRVDRQARYKLPARLLSYLDVAFLAVPGMVEAPEKQRISRAVIDYIVSLTEIQAIELNARLAGGSVQSMLDNWVHV